MFGQSFGIFHENVGDLGYNVGSNDFHRCQVETDDGSHDARIKNSIDCR